MEDRAVAASRQTESEASIKETVEAILVAFILAFIFRGFVVEAFVIPTGSMAPTLMGAHMRFTCDDCGYQFEVNYNTGSSDDLNVPAQSPKTHTAICPNCGYQIRDAEPTDQAYRPLIRYGDRILVLKYLYLFQDPSRWDVIVFKSPDRPEAYDYSQNYIKRLIGKPNEAIMILDGDIYAGPANARREDLKIQTKPRDIQNALWRIIHDGDYEPRGLARNRDIPAYRQPWKRRGNQPGWDLGDQLNSTSKRMFNFDNLTGTAGIEFDDVANVRSMTRTSAFNDWLAYDVEQIPPAPDGGWNHVGDLKLQMYYQRRAGDGPLQLLLSKGNRRFVAEISPTSARLLTAEHNGAESELIPPQSFPRTSQPIQIEFTNVDYQVSLRINDRLIFQTTPEQYHPDIPALLAPRNLDEPKPEVRIFANMQKATISHLSLWRDIYYLNRGNRGDGKKFAGSPDSVMRLNSDEYFAMGDNSQISGDGRYWLDPVNLPYERLTADAGKVPGRFLLGKAFFVYWPAGYRPFESANLPALAPNFGEMRMIH